MLLTIATALTTGATLAVPQEPAVLHPADAAIVVQFPDVQGLVEAYASTSLARMISDPDLHASIGRLMNPGVEEAPAVDPIALLMGEYHKSVDNGQMVDVLPILAALSSISMSLDVDGGDLFAFIEAMDDAQDEEAFAAANMGFRLVVDFTTAEAAATASALLKEFLEAEAPGSSVLRASSAPLVGANAFGADAVEIWSFAPEVPGGEMDPFTSSIRIVSGGSRLALAAGDVAEADFVRSLGAANAGGVSPRFAAGRKSFGKAPATPVVELYMTPFVERALAQEMPEALPALDVAEALLGPFASMFIRGGHWRIGLDDGQFVTEGLCAPAADGPMTGLIGSKPLTADALTLSHPDALVTSVTSLDPDVLARLIRTIAEQEGEGFLDHIQQTYGFRPDTDIAAALGNAVSYSLPSLKSLLAAPNLMGAAQLRDRDAFIRGMDGVLAMLQDGQPPFTVQRKEYKGQMLYTLTMNSEAVQLPFDGLPFDPAMFIRPTITVLEDRVMFTTLPSHAQKEVRRIAKLKKNGEPLGVHAGITALGNLEGATTVGYADWPTFFGNLYAQLKSLAPLLAGLGGGSGELPIDVNQLPEAEQLTRHFRPSERWTRRTAQGVLHYSKSSIGPEAGIVPAAGAAALFGMRTQQNAMREWEAQQLEAVPAEPIAPEDEAGGAQQSTRNTIEDVAVAITLYQLDHDGSSPAALSDLLETTADYSEGYLGTSSVPKDGWGRDLVYSASGGEFQLRSVGPNGVDEQGAGDDVKFD